MEPSETWPARELSPNQSGKDPAQLFKNPFTLEDVLVFDDLTLRRFFTGDIREFNTLPLAQSLHNASGEVIKRIEQNLPAGQLALFREMLYSPCSDSLVHQARQQLLDRLFWELIYWKTPDLYHALTEGEALHPGIFQQLEANVRSRVILDAASGSGRATLECLHHGANLIYAVDPSPGLLHILECRLAHISGGHRVLVRQGSFDHLPLTSESVDLALACSAFSSSQTQGGEPGLAELRRVTKPGGKIVIISPCPQDYHWFALHRFQYAACPPLQDAHVHFRSVDIALRCARLFYANNPAVTHYILERQQAEIPYVILGFSQPHDYCWLAV